MKLDAQKIQKKKSKDFVNKKKLFWTNEWIIWKFH